MVMGLIASKKKKKKKNQGIRSVGQDSPLTGDIIVTFKPEPRCAGKSL